MSYGDEVDKATFSKRFTQPVVISELGIGEDRLASLQAAQMSDLLQSRTVLAEFFRNLEDPKGSIRRYVTSMFSKGAPTRQAARKALVADETTVLEVAVSDYELHSGGSSLGLSFFVIVMSEGTLAVSEGKAALIKEGSTWRISNISAGH